MTLKITVVDESTFLSYELIKELVSLKIFEIHVAMDNIKKFDKVIIEIMNSKDINYIPYYNEFREEVRKFKNLAGDLETLISDCIRIEEELSLPINFGYKKLLKTIRKEAIPNLPDLS